MFKNFLENWSIYMIYKLMRIVNILVLLMLSFSAMPASLEDEIRDIANATAKSLPIRVNESIQATSIAAAGRVLLHHYNFLKKVNEIVDIDNVKNELFLSSINSSCTKPEVKVLLEQGAYLKYEFYDIDNRFIFDYTIDREACGFLKSSRYVSEPVITENDNEFKIDFGDHRIFEIKGNLKNVKKQMKDSKLNAGYNYN